MNIKITKTSCLHLPASQHSITKSLRMCMMLLPSCLVPLGMEILSKEDCSSHFEIRLSWVTVGSDTGKCELRAWQCATLFPTSTSTKLVRRLFFYYCIFALNGIASHVFTLTIGPFLCVDSCLSNPHTVYWGDMWPSGMNEFDRPGVVHTVAFASPQQQPCP